MTGKTNPVTLRADILLEHLPDVLKFLELEKHEKAEVGEETMASQLGVIGFDFESKAQSQIATCEIYLDLGRVIDLADRRTFAILSLLSPTGVLPHERLTLRLVRSRQQMMEIIVWLNDDPLPSLAQRIWAYLAMLPRQRPTLLQKRLMISIMEIKKAETKGSYLATFKLNFRPLGGAAYGYSFHQFREFMSLIS